MERLGDLVEPIWEQQKGETSTAYMLFCLYRDFGPQRTAGKVFNKYNGKEFNYTSPDSLYIYSGPCKWAERSQAWDSSVLEEETRENERLIKKFNKDKMVEALDMMNENYNEMKKDAMKGSLQPREKRERYKLGFDMFRTINNMDKESKVEHSGTVKIVFGDELEDV